MNKISTLAFVLVIAGIIVTLGSVPAYAVSVPVLSLANNAGSTQVSITVYEADPNATVTLGYPSSSSYGSATIGTTNSSGSLTAAVDSLQYGIQPGAPVYVSVDGQQSQTQVWPNYSGSGGLSLNQSSLSLNVGQSASVFSSVSAPLSITNNSNPSVASTLLSGNQVNVTGNTFGNTTITLCASGIGCNNIQVSVQNASSVNASISFSQTQVTISAGQSEQVTMSGSGSYYISSNSNSAIASASVNGSILQINAITAGTDSLTICSTSGSSATCGIVNVTVTTSANSTTSATPTSLTFSPSSLTLSTGQTQTVSILGGNNSTSVYIVSSNSNPSAVTANTNGASVIVSGAAFGGANLNICQFGGACGNLYVYVSTNSVVPTQTNVTTTNTPALTNISISSNLASTNFADPGNVLNLTLSFNQTISTPTVSIAGSAAPVTGTGSGPYTVSYAIPVNASLPVPVAITFMNPAGTGGQAYFWMGNSSTAPLSNPSVVSSTATAINCPAGYSCAPQTVALAPVVSSTDATASESGYQFNDYLYMGMTPETVVNPDIKALQERLKIDGLYSGPITGYFGPLTKTAVEAYQAKHGLEQVGVVGPSTRTLLNQGI